jgi:Rap1-interacting factor 1 N terminal
MVSADVLVSSAVVNPAPSISSPNITELALNTSHCQPESFPSPPESSAKSEQRNPRPDAHLPLNAFLADTPDLSPVSWQPSLEAGSGRQRKRVDFSPWTASTDVTCSDVSIRSLPPSRECQSSKSILKPGRPSLPSREEVPERIDDLPMMLDTILQQLASVDRQIRLDAYSTLCSALKAYSELPDGQITKDKIHALLAFIRTDLTRQIGESMEPVETNLMLQALKLLVVVVWNKALSAYLTDSYRCFLLDHSTRILEERKMPKAVILHYLHLLSTQEFPSRTMTTGRAVKLLETLNDLSEHVRGNGVVLERLMVYQRIFEQAKSAFKSRPMCWIPRLLTAMTSSVPDTRKKAISLGYRAAMVLGPSSTVATAVRESLDTFREQEDVLSSRTCKRLLKMLKYADEARQVPQIWAVVMLLMKGLEQTFNEWQHLHDWLRIMQKCFNCSNSEVRVEANKAWNKLIYVVRPYEGPTSYLTKMLMKPITVQLDRPSSEKQSKNTRNAAFAAYCNLLYYALKPSASFSQCDAVWDEYLVSAFKPSFLSSEQNSDRACRILSALFWRENVSPWRENRALDAAVIEPEELPLLDCKWIRSRTRSILEAFELLFRSSCWGTAAYPDNAYIAVAWRSFARALGDACRKEVIPSTETRESVICLSRFLTQVCRKGPAAFMGPESDFIRRIHFICKTVLLDLGPMFFIEGALANGTDGRSTAFNTEASPKARPPIVDLLQALQGLPGTYRDEEFIDVIVDLLQLTRKSRASPSARIHLYSQCSAALVLEGTCMSRSQLTWTAISKLTYGEGAAIGVHPPLDSIDGDDVAADVERILARGVPYQEGECEAWSALLKQSLVLGDGFKPSGMMIVERLTTCLSNQSSNPGSFCTAILVQAFLTVIQASKTTGTREFNSKTMKKQREAIVCRYRRVASLLGLHLSRMYGLAESCDEAALQPLVDVTISLLQASPTEYTLVCLVEIQESLALWLEDKRHLINMPSRAENPKIAQARKLCSVVIDVLGKLSKDIDLRSLDRLFAACFKSTHKITINHMVKMWNSNYGERSSLEYGGSLKESLTCLMPFVGLELPGLPDLDSHKSFSFPSDFLECIEEDNGGPGLEESPEGPENDQPNGLPAVDNVLQQEHSGAIYDAETSTPVKKHLKRRLCHDDSQVHFVSIESSPLPGENAESRNLTARQKLVRERQDREAALLFPDLRSSPTRRNNVSKSMEEALNLVPAGAQHGPFDTVARATPALSSRQCATYVEASRFSPTPNSKQQALRLEDIEVPSSPLSVPGLADSDHQTETPLPPSCENHVQAPPSMDNLQERETPGSVAVDFLPLAHEQGARALEDRANLSTNSLAVGEYLDQIHSEQAPSPYGGKAITDTAQELPAAESRARNDAGLGGVLMHALVVDGSISDEVIIPERSSRGSAQTPEVAGPFLKVLGVTTDVTIPGTTLQTDGSAETHSSRTFETPANDGTIAEEQVQVHSDDNDFWSASQLSQDLERAASSTPSPSPGEPSGQSVSAVRKRKQSPEAPQGSKRTKTTVEAREKCRVSVPAPELHPSQVIYDCIKVDASSSSQHANSAASALSQPLGSVQPIRRGRGRPRKSQPSSFQTPTTAAARKSLDEVSNNSRSLEATPKDDVCLPSKADRGQDVFFMPSEHSTSSMHQIPGAAGAVNREPASPCDSIKVKSDEKENQVPPEEAVELLHEALSSLKRTSMTRSDLRAIDDLVFEIRTEAQHAAQRRESNGT